MTYSSALSTGRRKFATRHQNAVGFQDYTKNIGPVAHMIMIVVLICLLGLLYLTQATKTNANAYEIDNLKSKHAQLQLERSELELASARLQSIDRVAGSGVNKSMRSVSPVETLR